MPTDYNGQPDNIKNNYPAAVNISGTVAGTPPKVNTSTPHGLETGDWVHTKGHHTGVECNGIYSVTVLSPTQFQPNVVVTGSGDASATGTVQPLTTGTTPIPSDGDDVDAAAVNPCEEETLDRTAFTAAVVLPSHKLSQIQEAHGGNDPGTSWSSTAVGSATTWVPSGTIWTLNDLAVGDVVDVMFTSTLDAHLCTTRGAASLQSSNYAPGASPPAYTIATGSSASVHSAAKEAPCALHAQIGVGTNGSMDIQLFVWGDTNTDTVILSGGYKVVFKVFRPTGAPQ